MFPVEICINEGKELHSRLYIKIRVFPPKNWYSNLHLQFGYLEKFGALNSSADGCFEDEASWLIDRGPDERRVAVVSRF